MKVLLADDEIGIREGLATFLRLKGVEVLTAGRCDEALSLLASERFDVVLTDWHLEDGVASEVVARSGVPVLVVSGYPEEVTTAPNLARVLSKPVAPAAMLEQLRACAPTDSAHEVARSDGDAKRPSKSEGAADPLANLPVDARERFELILDWSGAEQAGASVDVRDEGRFATLEIVWSAGEDPLADMAPPLEQVADWLGGDLRVLCRDSQQRLQYRIRRDGSPAEGLPRVEPDGRWPVEACRLDFHGASMAPARFLDVLRRAARRSADEGTVHFCNVPARLRLLAEASGHGALLPKREPVGPRIPDVLTALWN